MLKVGMRVKKIALYSAGDVVPVGAVGEIIGYTSSSYSCNWRVEYDAYPTPVLHDALYGRGSFAADFMLAPLTNPGTERDAAAERFIDSLKKLGREPVTLTEKELLRVSGGQPSGCAPIVGRGGK